MLLCTGGVVLSRNVIPCFVNSCDLIILPACVCIAAYVCTETSPTDFHLTS